MSEVGAVQPSTGRRVKLFARVPSELAARLAATADAEGETASALVRRALVEHFARIDARAARAAARRAAVPVTGATQPWRPDEVGRPDERIGDGLAELQRLRDQRNA